MEILREAAEPQQSHGYCPSSSFGCSTARSQGRFPGSSEPGPLKRRERYTCLRKDKGTNEETEETLHTEEKKKGGIESVQSRKASAGNNREHCLKRAAAEEAAPGVGGSG